MALKNPLFDVRGELLCEDTTRTIGGRDIMHLAVSRRALFAANFFEFLNGRRQPIGRRVLVHDSNGHIRDRQSRDGLPSRS